MCRRKWARRNGVLFGAVLQCSRRTHGDKRALRIALDKLQPCSYFLPLNLYLDRPVILFRFLQFLSCLLQRFESRAGSSSILPMRGTQSPGEVSDGVRVRNRTGMELEPCRIGP